MRTLVLLLSLVLAGSAADPEEASTAAPLLPCALEYIKGVEAPELNYVADIDQQGVSVSCMSADLEIEYQGDRYRSLYCTESGGWEGEQGSSPFDPPVSSTQDLTISCMIKSCRIAASIAGEASLRPPRTTIFTCPPGHKFKRGDRYFGPELTCTFSEGWRDERAGLIGVPATEELTGDCVVNPYCNTFVDGPGILPPDVIHNTARSRWECKPGNPAKNAVELDGQLLHSYLQCSEERGWQDTFGNVLHADPLAVPNITCGQSPCARSASLICSALSGLSSDYECSSNFVNPFRDDLFLVNCGDHERLYDSAKEAFLDNWLRCKDDGGYYLVGDDSKATVLGKGDRHNLACVNLRCNKCRALPELADVTHELLNATYHAGNATNCAQMECPSGLWLIKRREGEEPEEFAGEIECSSEAVAAFTWLVDGNAPVEAASCIKAIASCAQAVHLDTGCTRSWITDAGCIDFPTPTDDEEAGPNRCPSGTSLFFKQAGEEYFTEGGASFTCDQKRGKWEVKSGSGAFLTDLKRNAHVLCATANPTPVTTPAPPVVKACEVCPSVQSMLYSCDTCSGHASDIRHLDKGTACELTSLENGGNFATDVGKVAGVLTCDPAEKIWKTPDGLALAKFAAYRAAPEEKNVEEGPSPVVIGCSIAGVVVFVALLVVGIRCFLARRAKKRATGTNRTARDEEETKKKMLTQRDEDTKRKARKERAGNNDEILNDVAVDAPAELKL